MSGQDIFIKKLSAFLHDPIDKPFILMQGESHEQRAARLADLLQVSLEKAEGPDWIASAMERVLLHRESSLKEELQVKFLDSPEIKHPLSGRNLNCKEIRTFPVHKIKEIVEKSASELAVDDPEKQYLTLWRNYLAKIRQNSPSETKKYWSVIPADTRIPDHSIFEHLRMTSACFNAMADKENDVLRHNLAFLLCTIGPVQSFIATARKLQDLWMGSFILSYLTWAGIKVVVQKYGPDAIIFPDLYKQPLVDHWLKIEKGIEPLGYIEKDLVLPSFPNRFLAIIPSDIVNEVGKEVESEIRETFLTKGFEAIHNLKGKSIGRLPGLKIDPQLFEDQLKHFLNIYWVAVPWPQSEDGRADWQVALDTFSSYYFPEHIGHFKEALQFFSDKGQYPPNIGTVYELLYGFTEKAMGSRKSIRNFDQVLEEGQKCSLCGERRAFKESEEIRKYQKGLMAEKEFLCGVCLIKRLGQFAFDDIFKAYLDIEFPSIAEVAVSNLKLRLLQKKQDDFKAYVEQCRSLFKEDVAHSTHLLPKVKAETGYKGINIGGEFFIKDFLTESNLKQALNLDSDKPLPKDKANQLNNLTEKLTALISASFTPTPYYAVIMLDGDNMGGWLKGDFAPTIDQAFHSRVWENLPEDYKKDLKKVCREGKRPMSPAIHGAISAALRDYSLSLVKRIVEEHHLGKLIYAGGDDVLAVVNLRDLFSVMVELRGAFSGHIDRSMNVDFTEEVSGFVDMGEDLIMTMGPTATASAGVVIAHYKMPFALVLDKVRDMEKKAKKLEDKDAFAISLMKHSGEVSEGVAKWKYEDNNYPGGTVAILGKLADWIRTDWISNKFIYSFQDEFLRLADSNGIVNVTSEIVGAEIQRLLRRSTKKKNEAFETKLESLAKDLYQLFLNLNGSLESFLTLLQTSNFLAREVEEVKKDD